MRKTHHSCAVVITKQFRVSSRMSQSALALDHLRTLSCVAACTHATFAQQHLCGLITSRGSGMSFTLCDITCGQCCFVDKL